MNDPPLYRYAAKAFVALGAAVVSAGAVILAAVDDDHLTTAEVVAIVLAVLAGLGGPAAVFAVRNALRPEDVPQIPAGPQLPADFVDHAIVRRHPDGTVDLTWPAGRGTTLISPDLLEGIVEEQNMLAAKAAAAAVADGSAAAARAYPPPPAQRPEPWTPPGGAT